MNAMKIYDAYEKIMEQGQDSANDKVLNGIEAFSLPEDTLVHLRGEGVELTVLSTHRIRLGYNQTEFRDRFLEKLATLTQ
ncbi:DUF3081 family protein [uncultured Vibrio sp.]|uniref:DUF3081 family protein n=1 Tax=uncultured Vibrio sp. TaxID=114054 RepID=UPI0025EAB7D7|nr:DUF3081 family protein [uncultured Vibrio sp.]